MKKGWNRMLMVLCVIMLVTAGQAIGAPFQGSLLAEGSGDSYWTFGSSGTAV